MKEIIKKLRSILKIGKKQKTYEQCYTRLMVEIDNLATDLEEGKYKNKELSKYVAGFDILYEYFDSIADEEKPDVNKRLKKLGL